MSFFPRTLWPHSPDNRHGSSDGVRLISFFILFTCAAFLIQLYTGGYLTDRGNHGDEAGHFVSSLVIADYLSSGLLASPLGFAIEYYSHFPKVAIGHWPPVFELLQALIFFIFGGSGAAAIALQAVIAGFCAALPAAIMIKYVGKYEAALVGFIVLFSPAFLPLINMVMADTLVAMMVTLSAYCWSRFYRKRTWRSALLFSFSSALAILTKGNAFGLVFLPFIYLAIKRDFAFLFNPKTLVSAALVAVLALPWYIFTYQMAADGFVYEWGLTYTRLAMPFFITGLIASIGIPCVLAYIYGFYLSIRHGREKVDNDPIDMPAYVSASLAMLFFSILVPADLDRRYLVAALPCIAIVSVGGIASAATWAMQQFKMERAGEALAIAILLVSILSVFQVPNPKSYHAEHLVDDILNSGDANSLVLISGSVPAEGAFISSFADRDKEKRFHIIRAQKALAKTNWMATQYELKFRTPEEVADWIKENKIGWIVLDTDSTVINFPHNSLLKEAIDKGLLQTNVFDASTRVGGEMTLYALPAVTTAPPVSDQISPSLAPGHLGDMGK